jgi:hypothetical protein
MSAALLLTLAAACSGASGGADPPASGDADSPAAGDAAAQEAVPPNALTAAEREAGFELLFDGETADGWHVFRGEGTPGWEVRDGALVRVASGGDLVTDRVFSDFELRLEWMVEPGGNSGIMYRVTDEAERTFHSGPELQVLDDAGHPNGESRLTAAGACYGLYPAAEGAVRPAGEWNRTRIVVDSAHVEHWLNGVKVAEFELGSEDWERRVTESKFTRWPEFGRVTEGRIALQDHGDLVRYRTIRVRELDR